MARNKYPEETVNLILDVAGRLFMEKGYERTSIQDIIDNLGGLSKGAIYHHFKSKEEILDAVTDRIMEESNRRLAGTLKRKDQNGIEKLRTLFKSSLCRSEQDDIFKVVPGFYNNPRLLVSLLYETVELTAPEYILPIIREGIADGSIVAEHPKQLAELISLVANVWINPMVFDDSEEETYYKFLVFDKMLRGMGLDIVDEEMIARMRELTAIYRKNK